MFPMKYLRPKPTSLEEIPQQVTILPSFCSDIRGTWVKSSEAPKDMRFIWHYFDVKKHVGGQERFVPRLRPGTFVVQKSGLVICEIPIKQDFYGAEQIIPTTVPLEAPLHDTEIDEIGFLHIETTIAQAIFNSVNNDIDMANARAIVKA